MKKMKSILFIATLIAMIAGKSYSQVYTFEDFVGTWHGTISSTYFGGYNDPITMTIESDGFYAETSGHLMPTLYPNTQQCEYQASTNRMHWWYLGTVWGGQYFYDHFYYEVVYFQNDTLEMHYNFWDDPVPSPDAGTIFMVKESLTPPPTSLDFDIVQNSVILSWDAPSNNGGPTADLQGYNIYHRYAEDYYELLDFAEENEFIIEGGAAAGTHNYYVTAVYDEGESNASNEIEIEFMTPPPTELEGQLLGNNVALYWNEPSIGNGAMAELLGYNVYHKEEGGDFEMLMYVETSGYGHENISPGIHNYYVTAVYDGGESDPSNTVEVALIISGLEDEISSAASIYPNPASDLINISSEYEINRIRIFNHSGQVVNSKTINSNNYTFDINDLPSGLYILNIDTKEGLISKRIIVQ